MVTRQINTPTRYIDLGLREKSVQLKNKANLHLVFMLIPGLICISFLIYWTKHDKFPEFASGPQMFLAALPISQLVFAFIGLVGVNHRKEELLLPIMLLTALHVGLFIFVGVWLLFNIFAFIKTAKEFNIMVYTPLMVVCVALAGWNGFALGTFWDISEDIHRVRFEQREIRRALLRQNRSHSP